VRYIQPRRLIIRSDPQYTFVLGAQLKPTIPVHLPGLSLLSDVETETNCLHQGITNRDFERKFQLADHVKVANAKLENGLLHIELAREIPEVIKPKTIAINSGLTGLNSVQAA